MIFALYSFNKDNGTTKEPIAVGPILSDAEGRFVVPKFYKKQWYLEHMYMGDCGGSLLFIHPSLGAYTVLMCTDDFPPDRPFKDLAVHQDTVNEKWTTAQIKYSYHAIEELPKSLQPMAWAHVVPEMRGE